MDRYWIYGSCVEFNVFVDFGELNLMLYTDGLMGVGWVFEGCGF